MLSSKEKKRLYDIEYRRKNKEKIKARKKAYYKANKKELYAKQRAKVDDKYRARHAAYCRQPEYAERKRKYDRVIRSLNKCGEFWESDIIAIEIIKECKKQAPSKKDRLYYKLNTKRINKRNEDKRIAKAVEDIIDGKAKEVLRRPWKETTKRFLEQFC